MSKNSVPQIKLSNGETIPQFGLGVYQIPNSECEEVCLKAIKLGYRHIDTAQIYGNEKAVGSAIKKNNNIPREDFYITTKIWINDFEKGKALKQVDEMLKRLNTKYIDLLLYSYGRSFFSRKSKINRTF